MLTNVSKILILNYKFFIKICIFNALEIVTVNFLNESFLNEYVVFLHLELI